MNNEHWYTVDSIPVGGLDCIDCGDYAEDGYVTTVTQQDTGKSFQRALCPDCKDALADGVSDDPAGYF